VLHIPEFCSLLRSISMGRISLEVRWFPDISLTRIQGNCHEYEGSKNLPSPQANTIKKSELLSP